MESPFSLTRLRTIPVPIESAEGESAEADDSETILVQAASMQDSTDQVDLTINHNPATVETEAEALLSEKSKTDTDEREKKQENEKENDRLNNDLESAETLLEVERKPTACCHNDDSQVPKTRGASDTHRYYLMSSFSTKILRSSFDPGTPSRLDLALEPPRPAAHGSHAFDGLEHFGCRIGGGGQEYHQVSCPHGPCVRRYVQAPVSSMRPLPYTIYTIQASNLICIVDSPLSTFFKSS